MQVPHRRRHQLRAIQVFSVQKRKERTLFTNHDMRMGNSCRLPVSLIVAVQATQANYMLGMERTHSQDNLYH